MKYVGMTAGGSIMVEMNLADARTLAAVGAQMAAVIPAIPAPTPEPAKATKATRTQTCIAELMRRTDAAQKAAQRERKASGEG